MYESKLNKIREQLRAMILDEIGNQIDGDFDLEDWIDICLIKDAVSERLGNAIADMASDMIDEVADEVFEDLF